MSRPTDPAFPHPSGVAQGLTKREWFAGMALQGLLAHASGEDPRMAPAMAYQIADAMIEAGKSE